MGGVAFDSEGNLVVADHGNHRAQVLCYSDGAHLHTIGSYGRGAGQFQYPTGVAFIGSQGSGNGRFNYPHGGIAIDSDGRIVVADTQNHRVQVLE